MGNLSALKGIVDYKGISITEDLTLEQRKEFRTLSMEAKNHNEKDDIEYELRVRGSSKTGSTSRSSISKTCKYK